LQACLRAASSGRSTRTLRRTVELWRNRGSAFQVENITGATGINLIKKDQIIRLHFIYSAVKTFAILHSMWISAAWLKPIKFVFWFPEGFSPYCRNYVCFLNAER